jgi:hypothetical protein
VPTARQRSSAALAVTGVQAVVLLHLTAARATIGAVGTAAPPPGVEEAAAPLGVPVTPAFPSRSYAFLGTQDDGVTPITWDPCRPIHYVVNPRTAPADGDRLLGEAIAQVSAVTGLTFVEDGRTDETYAPDRPAYQPGRYGRRWAPVLVDWPPDLTPEGDRTVAGRAGPLWVRSPSGRLVSVSGTVQLSGSSIATVSRQLGDAYARGIIEHELGHLVGLDHVDDPTQVMYPSGTRMSVQFGPGDVSGLAALGAGACDPGV